MSLPLILPALQSAFAAIGPGLQAALAIGGAVTDFAAAKGQADAQSKANKIASETARQNMLAEYDQTSRMMLQETAAAGQKIDKNQIDAAKTAATAKVAASAGGVGGLSVDALLTDIYGQEAGIRDSVNQNLENTGHQIKAERDGATLRYKNTVSSLPMVNRPSLIGAGLKAATGVYGAYKDTVKVRGDLG